MAWFYLWKEFQDELHPKETFTKNAPDFFYFVFLCNGFPILDNFYKTLG